MKVEDSNIVTTPGASEPQGSAMVSESGVYTGSQVAGSLGSSTGNGEGTGVASQAPATLSTTSAETIVSQEEKTKIAELENELKEADDITVSGWTYEVWTGLDEDLKKMDALVNRLFAFTSQTRNVHKEVKAISSELKDLMKRAKGIA